MSPAWTFAFGILLLFIFGWYYATDIIGRKRKIGLLLTLLIVAFCVDSATPPEKKIRLGLDLKGGTSFLIRLVQRGEEPVTSHQQQQAMEVIRKRVDVFGVSEPVIAPVGSDRIRVEIPGLDAASMQDAQAQLQRVAKLEFALVHPNSEAELRRIEVGEAILNPEYAIKTYKIKDGRETIEGQLLVKKKPAMEGEHVTHAFPFFDQQGYGVTLKLDTVGSKLFGDITARHRGEQLAILLDGEVQSAPRINDAIYTGSAQITGHFDEKEARDLASVLENPLQTPVQLEEIRSASASLGADSIRSGIIAGLVGLALVIASVLLYYRMAGFIAIFGLIINLVMLFGLMAMFHFTLTLPGIAGVILTIGMAVDANVLIYERLREEMALGKTLRAAIEGAYDKAFSAIFDANLTTLITSIILFWQSVGPVRGFAVTLTLGIVASMFSALLVTRTAFQWMTDCFGLKKLSMLNLIPKKTFDFIGARHIALWISIVLITGSVAIFALRGKANFGIDFVGGDLIGIRSEQVITVEETRKALESAGLENAGIQKEKEVDREILMIRSALGTADQVETTMQEAFPDRGVRVESKEYVGSQIGSELAWRSLFALGLSMVGILIYCTVRFEFSFALGVIIALLHDVIITLGVFSLAGRELSLVMVGAILTIAGYSINDTIVVFDRIRENLKGGARGSVATVMNDSINETLSRTILTGGTTLLSIGALFIFGGPVLSDFAFAILIGILVGTYSSIYTATPVVLWWAKLTGKNIRRQVLETDHHAPIKA